MAAAPPPIDTPAPGERPFRSVNSLGLPDLLEGNGICLLVTTYQAGKLMAVRGRQGRISTLLRTFDRPMGLAVRDGRQFALGTRGQVWFFHNCRDIADQLAPPGSHDACFLPRTCSITGDIQGHDIAWGGDELWVVNTRFSCLCTLHAEYSFVPRWRPPFVSALAADDRCHLNGLAMVEGRPRYVTALGESDSGEGWRPGKVNGGIVIDVASGNILARGLSMPHSPRYHAGRLWVLDSGTGQLQTIDLQTGQRQTVAEMPGFTRGLAFYGSYAFVGLSRIRESAVFAGLPIADRFQQLACGIWVIDLRSGQTAEFMQFEVGVDEIFAVEVLSGIRYPEILGLKEETIHSTFVVP
jgi:uncharacterized protein (TIGR03032 family)